MKYLIKTLCVLAVLSLSSCGESDSTSGGKTTKPAFAKGADIQSLGESQGKMERQGRRSEEMPEGEGTRHEDND